MRNSILTFAQDCDAKYDDGVIVVSFTIPQIGVSLEDVTSKMDAAIAATRANPGFPDPNAWTFTKHLIQKAYFLFDKANFMKMVDLIPGFFYDECIKITDPTAQLLRVQLDESPRSTGWTDTAGIERAPAPSDAKSAPGARQTISIQLYLALLVRTYQAQRQYNAAFKAAKLLKLVNAGQLTTDQALAFSAAIDNLATQPKYPF